MVRVKIIPDDKWPNMYRIQWPDGTISDMANLTRCNDAVARFKETTERRKRHGRQTEADPV